MQELKQYSKICIFFIGIIISVVVTFYFNNHNNLKEYNNLNTKHLKEHINLNTEHLKNNINQVEKKVDEFKQETNNNFKEVNSNFNKLENKIDNKIDRLTETFINMKK
ncbi:hypothetical protein PSOLA_06060 [Candidatus Phytoplasma solani]